MRCSTRASTSTTRNTPESRNPQKKLRKPTHKVYIPSTSTAVYASSTILYLLSLLRPPSQYALFTFYSSILSRIQAPSSRHRCGSVTPPPPPPLLLLEFWRSLSRSLKRNTLREMAACVITDTIWSRRPFTIILHPVDTTISLPHNTSCQLVDELTALYPETSTVFHR